MPGWKFTIWLLKNFVNVTRRGCRAIVAQKKCLLIEMNNILSVFNGNTVTEHNFIEHRSMI